MAQDHPAAAVDDYDLAIALNPRFAPAFYNRGVAKEAGGDVAGAISDFNQAVALDPAYAAAYKKLVTTQRKQGNDAAAQAAEAALSKLTVKGKL